MILSGARVALGPEEAAERDLEIRGGVVRSLRPPGRGDLDLRGCLVLPGLVNAHDHLEFNLYPPLGRGPYSNAGAWARDVYHPEQSPVREHQRVPKRVRLAWGGLKNLLCGVTTVCHHNDLHGAVFGRRFPVRVVKRIGWAHSLEFSPDLAARFRATPVDWPFVLHLGEATDAAGRREIRRLDALGALDGRTVLVHAVAVDAAGLRLIRRRGASLVWCPSSNLFLLGRTLGAEALASGIPIALGSDSALTARGDLLDELRVARRTSGLESAELYRMVTETTARILRLGNGAGRIVTGGAADLAVFHDTGRSPAGTLLRSSHLAPEMVLVDGRIRLVSARLAPRLPDAVRRHLAPLAVEARGEVLVDADIAGLYAQAARRLGGDLRLAGKRVRVPRRLSSGSRLLASGF